MENEKDSWPGYIGGLILIIIFGTLALVAAGGWNWFAKFLENSASAWVQAFGSIFAIFVAIYIANKQHARQLLKDTAANDLIQKHRLDILYFSIENIRQTCSFIEEKIDETNNPIILDSLKSMYISSRSGLEQFPILEIQNAQLALAILELKQFAILGEKAFFINAVGVKRSTGINFVTKNCIEIQTKFWSTPTT